MIALLILLPGLVAGQTDCFQWEEWSTCDKTCGRNGRKHRYRKCSEKSNTLNCKGTECPDDDHDFGPCKLEPCSVDLSSTYCIEWEEWRACDKTCGRDGKRVRYRRCSPNSNTLNCKDTECPNDDHDFSPCKLEPCSVDLPSAFCVEWEGWSPCDKTCGKDGKRERYRRCSSRSKTLTCKGTKCPDDDHDFEPCKLEPCSTDCLQWEGWRACDKTCGRNGKRQRYRRCSPRSNTLKCKGTECPDDDHDFGPCKLEPCPGDLPSTYCVEWEAWSTCDKTCGRDGTEQRYRRCSPRSNSLVCKGTDCPDDDHDFSPCMLDPCQDKCSGLGWTQWGRWGTCDKLCGDDGMRERSRSCQVLPDTQTCRRQFCFDSGLPIDREPCPFLRPCITTSTPTTPTTPPCINPPCITTSTPTTPTTPPCINPPCITHPTPPTTTPTTPPCMNPPCSDQCSGGWAGWGDWGRCVASCGNMGQRSRSRQCLAIPASWDCQKMVCSGSKIQKLGCTVPSCPTTCTMACLTWYQDNWWYPNQLPNINIGGSNGIQLNQDNLPNINIGGPNGIQVFG